MHIINKKDILCCVHLPSQIYTGNEGNLPHTKKGSVI